MVEYNTGTVTSVTQKLSQDYELISTCYHEAGHTVSGLLNFMKIPAVTVNYADKRVEGFTHYELMGQEVSNSNIMDFLVLSEINISYAGLAAEQIFYKEICGAEKLPMMLKEGSSRDLESVADLIKKNNLAPPGRKRHLYKKKLIKEVRHSLEEHWDAVTLISHALYKKRKLYFDDLKALLTKKSNNKEFWKNKFREINILVNSSEELDEKEIRYILFK